MSLRLFRSTAIVGAMTSFSRVTGLARDIAFAQYLGSGLMADAFFVAFRIPNFFRRIFAEGAFSVAFVPVYSECEASGGEEQVREFLDSMCGRLSIILLAVTIIGVVSAPQLVTVLAPGFRSDPYKLQTTIDTLRFTFPYLFFISLVAMAAGIMNTRGRFSVPAVTPVILNIFLIATVLFFVPKAQNAAVALGFGVLLAGFAQLAFQLPFLKIDRRLPKPKIRIQNKNQESAAEETKKVFKLMLPALFGTSIAQLNLLINTIIASFLVTGSVSWLYYSDRLMEFPLAIIGIALATVILPSLSAHYTNRSAAEFSFTLEWALRISLLFSLPASVGLIVLAEPLMITLFHYGEFSTLDAKMSGKSLIAFAIGLSAFIWVKVLAPGYFARQDTKTPIKAGIYAIIANLVFSLLLYKPLQHVGLAYATSIAGFVNAALLYWWLRSSGIYHPGGGWTSYTLRIFTASLIMGLVLQMFVADPSTWVNRAGGTRVLMLIQWIAIANSIYFGSLYIMGVQVHRLFHRSVNE